MTQFSRSFTPRHGPRASRVGGAILILLLGGAFAFAVSAQEQAPDSTDKPASTFWEQHGKIEDPSEKPPPSASLYTPQGQIEQTPLTIASLKIPVQHGSIKKTHAAREPIILHIQDAHANYEAQKHLAAILEYLILHHGLELVLVEGGSRNDSLSYMREYAPLEKRVQVAEEFLKSGKISGENYLDLTSDYDFTVFGIEEPELYDANMEAFFNVERVQPKALTAIADFRQAVDALKARMYPSEVIELELKEAAVRDGQVPLAQHYEELAAQAESASVAVSETDFPNFTRFLSASRLEKELDFKAVEIERTRFLESLTRSLPKPEMDELLKESLELKRGLITPASFYGRLKRHFDPARSGDYPTLSRYITYLDFFEGIDHAKLFTEVERLSDRVKLSFLDGRQERELFRVSKDVGVLGDLLELRLTPDAYDYYRTHKREFRPDRWADTLRDLARRQGETRTFALRPAPLNAAMPAMASFYEVARKRDLAMVDKALKQIQEAGVPFAVLIAGGFHTPALEQLFKERSVSYAVVAPKVGKVTAADTEKYHRVLKETYVPMSERYRQKMGVSLPKPTARNALPAEDAARPSRTAGSTEVRPQAYPEGRAVALLAPEER